MRTRLLGGMALLLGASVLLGGADVARAQSSAGYAAYGYSPGYGQGYQGTTPASFRYPNYAQAGQSAWSSPYSYYPGYGYYPNYSYYYPNYYSGAQGYQGHQGYQGYSANQYQYPQGSCPSGPGSALPAQPLTSDEIPGDEAPPKKELAAGAAHRDRFWFSAGYDLSWVKPWKVPALVTTGSATAPAGVDPTTYHAGAIGQPTTSVLFGNSVDFGRLYGVRASAGLYLDDCDRFSLELAGQYQFAQHVHFSAGSDAVGNPLIARPFFNVVDQNERAFVDSDSAQALIVGGVSIDTRTQLIGAESNFRYNVNPKDRLRFDALAGFRFLRLGESLTIRDNLTPLPGSALIFETTGVAPPDTVSDVDSFKTVNHFYGLQLGGGATWEGKYLYANVFGKVGVGVTDQEVDINGSTTLFTPTGPQGGGGGVYALPTNIGNHTRPVFGWVPEGGVNFGVKVMPCLRLTAGYSFLYWNAVVRPGAQIDRGLNPSMVPTDISFGQGAAFGGPPRPAFHFNDETYWIHTVNFGLDFRY